VAPPAAEALTAAGGTIITVRNRRRIRWLMFATSMDGVPVSDVENISGFRISGNMVL